MLDVGQEEFFSVAYDLQRLKANKLQAQTLKPDH